MMTTLMKTEDVGVEDILVTFEDHEKTLQNLQEASDDIMMLDDDTTLISYHIETQKMLESAKEALEEEVRGYKERVSSMQQVLNGLEVQLCAKFGDKLEADES
uniref:Prefoldin subunit 4 n=1 Tax=Oryzias latipes TaxID=8090 RepID=A0A3P9KED5_ORYLA